MRRAKTDTNQTEIVLALRSVGASVQCLHIIGKGCPDLLVGYRGQNFLLEVKRGKAKLTGDEPAWHEDWQGQVAIVYNVADALSVLSVFGE